MGNCKI